MRLSLLVFTLAGCLGSSQLRAATSVVADYTNYNVGNDVRLRLEPSGAGGMVSIRYAGEDKRLVRDVPVPRSGYGLVWHIPETAETGRYDVDFTPNGGGELVRRATSFAVHKKVAEIVSVDLDKTFYTTGDSVNPTIVVRNVSSHRLENLQVEFEAYTFPWIAPTPDEPPMWKSVAATGLALEAGEERTFHMQKAAVIQSGNEPVESYYTVVVRDSTHLDRIYDIAYPLPAFGRPPNTPLPKQYPFLYLYWHLRDVKKSESYRHFYPPEFVSDVVQFDTSHTMFPAGVAPEIRYTVKLPEGVRGAAALTARVVDSSGHELEKRIVPEPVAGEHRALLQPREPGLYRLQVLLKNAAGTLVAQNQIEFAVNRLPKSILIFCAHQDDDTAHPGIIRAAVENHIPIHFVYFTSGDSGGCERYYMHTCDASRAMDFGEVRMDESRNSLGHLGVPRENLYFLGLPDGGMEQIWFHHPSSDRPYLSVLLASEHAPYDDVSVPNIPYSRDAAIAAAKQFIARFKPDMIITGHPDERHVDHRTNNWVVVSAMQELLREGQISRDTKLVVDVSYGAKPGRHAPYGYEPEKLFVSGEAAKLGQEALWYYESQDGNHQQAEIVDFLHLPRTEPYPHFRILNWWEHAGWNAEPEAGQ